MAILKESGLPIESAIRLQEAAEKVTARAERVAPPFCPTAVGATRRVAPTHL